MQETPYLIEVKNLKKWFRVQRGLWRTQLKHVRAIDGISFGIKKGETLGLVGESGCGKTTVGRTIIRLYDPTEGQVLYEGQDIARLTEEELKPYRRKVQMIFQDPYASLNPRMTVSDIIAEPLNVHGLVAPSERQDRVHELLKMVGLNPEHANRYPHEFSGGQRQRVGIARALAADPSFIICDEPISALDVSIQAQVVNLLEELQSKLQLTYLFIAHDLAMVKHISNRIAVMYLGKIVEIGPGHELYENPKHPYTLALLSAVPIPDPDMEAKRRRIILKGDVPSPIDPPEGCRFHTRCARVQPECKSITPELKDLGGGHMVACHLYD